MKTYYEDKKINTNYKDICKDLDFFMQKIDGSIDGHSMCQQEGIIGTVSILDLQEIYNDIETIMEKYFKKKGRNKNGNSNN